jgi:hypothetical protein
MKYYGNYSMAEVDELLPFEREIMYNLLVETKQKENQNQS